MRRSVTRVFVPHAQPLRGGSAGSSSAPWRRHHLPRGLPCDPQWAVLGRHARHISGASWWWSQSPSPAPATRIVRLAEPAVLRAEADATAEAVTELAAGDLVEAVGEVEEGGDGVALEWLLVRSPLEDKIEPMSDKPLKYEDGWLHRPAVERTEHQVGDRVAARVDVPSHPAVEVLQSLPPWRHGTALPDWVVSSVAELYTGKILGVVKQGRFLVQRPGGAAPERIATTQRLLITPRQRAKSTALAALVGLAISWCLGSALHLYKWSCRGESRHTGRAAWPKLVGWLTLITVFIAPSMILPCYSFASSKGSAACVVVWINMLFYCDLFNE